MTEKSTHARDAVCWSVGGVLLLAGMFAFHLVSPTVGWLLVVIGMPIYLVPFGWLFAALWRIARGDRP